VPTISVPAGVENVKLQAGTLEALISANSDLTIQRQGITATLPVQFVRELHSHGTNNSEFILSIINVGNIVNINAYIYGNRIDGFNNFITIYI